MLRAALSLPILAMLLATPAALEKGKDLPGPFNPYNVTGARAGRYHCLVTQTSLDPVVMIVVRDLDLTDSLQLLETELDNRIAKNPNVRLSSFTIFLSDELPKVVEDDDKRDELAAKLMELAKAKELKHVVLCLDSKPDLEHYGLDDNAWATVILVNRYKVVSVYPLTKAQLNAEKVKEIITDVSEHLGATKK